MINNSLSIIELRARKTLPAVLAIEIIMAAVSAAAAGKTGANYVNDRAFLYPMAAAIMLVFAVLAGRKPHGSNLSARLSLLKISQEGYYFADHLYCIMVYVLLWAFEAAALLIYFRIFRGVSVPAMYVDTQWSVMLKLLFPLEDRSFALARTVMVLTLGSSAASAHRITERGKLPLIPSVAVLIIVFSLLRIRRTGFASFVIFSGMAAFMSIIASRRPETESEAEQDE